MQEEINHSAYLSKPHEKHKNKSKSAPKLHVDFYCKKQEQQIQRQGNDKCQTKNKPVYATKSTIRKQRKSARHKQRREQAGRNITLKKHCHTPGFTITHRRTSVRLYLYPFQPSVWRRSRAMPAPPTRISAIAGKIREEQISSPTGREHKSKKHFPGRTWNVCHPASAEELHTQAKRAPASIAYATKAGHRPLRKVCKTPSLTGA